MKITDTSPHPLSGKTSQIAAKSDTIKNLDALPQFNQGDLIKAKVMGLGGDGKVILDVNGKTITAQSLIELKVGSELWLEIGKGGSLPVLALAGKKGAVQDFLKILLSGSLASAGTTGGKAPASLPSPLIQETPQGGTTQAALAAALIAGEPDADIMRTLIALLSGRPTTKKEFSDPAAGLTRQKTTEEIGSHPADKLTRLMTAHQEVNSQPPQGSNQNFYLFPCFFAGNTGWGEWLLALERDAAQKDKDSFSLSFFLDMSGIGPLAIHAAVADTAISGEFCLQSEKALQHIAANVPELRRILESRGYQPVAFSCRLDSNNIVSQLKDKLEQKASLHRFSLIDISV